MDIGKRLKARREALGLTLEEVGEALGVSRATVCRYESGEIDIKRTAALSLAKVLHVTPAYIMGWSDAITEPNDARLLSDFHELNEEGQEKVMDYAEDLNLSGRYKKDGKNRMDEKEA